jgi:hypothetical protein
LIVFQVYQTIKLIEGIQKGFQGSPGLIQKARGKALFLHVFLQLT